MPTAQDTELTPEIAAKVAEMRARAAAARAANGSDHAKWTNPAAHADAAPFYFELRAVVRELKAARENRGLSQEEIASACGTTVEAVERLERGDMTNPSWQMLGRYAVSVGKGLTISTT